MYEGNMVCLAGSRKWHGRCLAGMVLPKGRWIRPVSQREHRELHEWEYALPTPHFYTRVLDTVHLTLEDACPQPHHPEDFHIGDAEWALIHRPTAPADFHALRARLMPFLDHHPTLLGDCENATPHACFTQAPATASLTLVSVRGLRWMVSTHGEQKKTKVLFKHGEAWYTLGLTDPEWEGRVAALPDGKHTPQETAIPHGADIWLTISLGDPFIKEPGAPPTCHKLVAAVIVWP
jgi:hypothetical protein